MRYEIHKSPSVRFCSSFFKNMGSTSSNLVIRLFGKKQQVRILMVGLDDAGKTTILYKLKGDATSSTLPTVGFNVETLQYKNKAFTIWDIDGRFHITLVSRHYFQNTRGIIFVVDSHDRERLLEARDKLQEMLEEEELNGAAVLVFANKQDLPNAVSAAELADKLNKLNQLKDRKWHIQPASAIQDCGLQEGIHWLSRELSK